MTASADGTARVWDAASGEQATESAGPRGQGVPTLTYSPDGKSIVTAGFDGTARVWDTASGEQTRSCAATRD